MQLFSSHGDSCARAETEALKLAMRNGPDPDDEEPLKAYNDMLQVLGAPLYPCISLLALTSFDTVTTEELQHEATSLQDSITKLTESPSSPTATADPTASSTAAAAAAAAEDATINTDANTTTAAETTAARSQVTSVFASCLPVLRARSANLAMAQELIDTALENVSLGLRMESMGIA
jgi:predicted negative regulator of RcsB-dependent stress response